MSSTHDSPASLPAELLYAIFDYIPYPELLPVLHTCRSWRSVAKTCPGYWREISLELWDPIMKDDEGERTRLWEHELVAARLSSSTAPGLAIRWDLYTDHLVNCALPLLREHWHRVQLFSVAMSTVTGALDELLLHPAPLLDELSVQRFLYNNTTIPFLHLAPQTCMRLRTVTLGSIDVPHDATWVCPGVTRLVLRHTSDAHIPQSLFGRFPILAHLKLKVYPHGCIYMSPEQGAFNPLPSEELETVELTSHDFEGFLEALDGAKRGIKRMRWRTTYAAEQAWALADSLVGDIELRIAQDGFDTRKEKVHLTYTSLSESEPVVRRELSLFSIWEPSITRTDAEFLEARRTVRYVLSVCDTHALLGLRKMAACRHVVFLIPTPSALQHLQDLQNARHSVMETFPCPLQALHRISFQPEYEPEHEGIYKDAWGRVEADALRRFVELVVGAGARLESTQLDLCGFDEEAVADLDISVLRQTFEVVRFKPRDSWSDLEQAS